MSNAQLGVTVSSILGPTIYQAAPEVRTDPVLPWRLSTIRRFLAKMLHRSYGLYKLATAPHEALQLNAAASGTALARLVAEPCRKGDLAAQPLVSSKWPGWLRLRRMIEHCAVIDRLGHPFDLSGDQYVEIIKFELDGEGCRLMIDRPQWLRCDGMLCVSWWVGGDRVFSVSFCLADSRAGRTAYIGGIQGRASADALDQNRALTKAAHGMRPRDLAFELFRMLLPRLGVTRLKCVADACRYPHTRWAKLSIGLHNKVQLGYDEAWQSRGGVLGEDGFYFVPIDYSRREMADIPVKKRAMYKRRYAMLDALEAQIAQALQQPCVVRAHSDRF